MLDKRPLQTLTALLAIAAWMLLAHPYEGVLHDSVLYFGQTLLHTRVPSLAQDVFFAGGSQDRYSIFAHLMGPLYAVLGQAATHMGLLMLSWLLACGAVLALLTRFERAGATRWWGLLTFAVMSPIYGGGWVFSYGEPFVTARTVAEPLLLWSLVALLAGHRLAAMGLTLLAALFHPLMTLPVIAVSWCFLVGTDRRWLWLLTAIPAVLLAGAAGMPPWDGLLKIYDPYWWSLVSTGNEQVLISNWTLEEGLTVALDLAVLLAVTRLRAKDAWTRLLLATAWATFGLFALSVLGADLLHSVLMTQLQLWRVHWIAHLLAMALAPWLVARLWALDGLWQASACALALALLDTHIGAGHGVATLLLWAATSLAAWRIHGVSPVTARLAAGLVVLCILALSAHQLDHLIVQRAWEQPQANWGDRFIKFAAFPALALPSFGALAFLSSRHGVGAALALGLSGLLFGAAVHSWDQRPDLLREVESPTAKTHPFARHLPAGVSVYWPGQLAPVWGLLERPSHYNQQQGAGMLFNRDTGLIFGPRKEAYRLIDAERKRCRAGARFARDREALQHCALPAEHRLRTLCQYIDAPDFLVLPGRLSVEALATWQPPASRDLPQAFHLYACKQLRAE